MKILAICKQDCDFSALLSAGFTNDTQSFILNVAKYLAPNVAATCGQSLSQFISNVPVTLDNILSSLSINSFDIKKKIFNPFLYFRFVKKRFNWWKYWSLVSAESTSQFGIK